MAYFKVLSERLPGESEENHETLQSEQRGLRVLNIKSTVDIRI